MIQREGCRAQFILMRARSIYYLATLDEVRRVNSLATCHAIGGHRSQFMLMRVRSLFDLVFRLESVTVYARAKELLTIYARIEERT